MTNVFNTNVDYLCPLHVIVRTVTVTVTMKNERSCHCVLHNQCEALSLL